MLKKNVDFFCSLIMKKIKSFFRKINTKKLDDKKNVEFFYESIPIKINGLDMIFKKPVDLTFLSRCKNISIFLGNKIRAVAVVSKAKVITR